MAMRQRGDGIAPIRPRAAMRPVFEDFKPMSEKIQEKDSEILRVHLHGFLREQIKLSTESTKVLRVRGDRLVAGNKWSRFQVDFDIPENCNIGGIRAKFEGGILTVTMPRKTISPQYDSKTEATTTQKARTPQDAPVATKPPIVQEDNIQAKPHLAADTEKQRDSKSVRPPSPQKASNAPKPQKVQNETPPKVTSTSHNDKQREAKGSLEALGSHEGPSEPKSQKGDKNETPVLKIRKNAKHETAKKEKSGEASKGENVVKKVEQEKEKSDGNVGEDERKAKDYPIIGKVEQTADIIGGIGGLKFEDYKLAAKGLAKGLNEERQLAVNMGAAVLVIVALGAYISYTFGSSAKS